MKKFHICYLLTRELCSGKNVWAADYLEAIKLFTTEFNDKEIVYVTKLES